MTAEPSPDLVDRLTAAADAIANEAQSLAYEPERIRGVVIELYLNARGQVDDGRAFVERKAKVRR